jgi:maltokinase
VADPATVLRSIDEETLGAWLRERRWFGAKAADLSHFGVLDVVPLREDAEHPLALALLEARFNSGMHDLYQVLVGVRDCGSAGPDAPGAIGGDGTQEVFDALADPGEAGEIVTLMQRGATIPGEQGTVAFHWTGALKAPAPGSSSRPMGVEQSNSTIVFDERLALKLFRRLLPGENPELEMLRFLQTHGFQNLATVGGYYDLAGERIQTTLGILQRFVSGAREGWAYATEDPQGFLERAGDLGRVTGQMHAVLASDMTEPDFAPEEPGDEYLGLLTATIDEEIERTFLDLPDDDPAVAPIVGRGQEVRDRLQMLSHQSAGGRLIRQHGDYHLGQVLLAPEGWVVLDFEGEPARSLPERRRKVSPLRDVAGMLRSFAYAASASAIQRSMPAPGDFERRARETFLERYLDVIDSALLPAGEAGISNLLSIFELEKAIYELQYELDNRPDWLPIPVAGITRLLEEVP